MSKCLICHESIEENISFLNLFNKPKYICSKCESKLSFNKNIDRCSRCLKTLKDGESDCLDCLWLAKRYQLVNQVHTIYDYNDDVKKLMHRYKFLGDVALLRLFHLPKDILKQYDYITPAPIHSYKLHARTFDHVTTVMVDQNVKYKQFFSTELREKQSALTKMERAKQVNPFKLTTDLSLTNKSVLIVDDIYTTGITVHQLAERLFVRKIRKIDVLTFARG